MPNEIVLKKGYFLLKPILPRKAQLYLRRKYVSWKRPHSADIWPIDFQTQLAPRGWSGWPEGKQFALVLTHDVETEAGQEKSIPLAKLEESLGFRSSFNFIGEQYAISPHCHSYLKKRGFEIGLHGLIHNGNPFRSRKVFEKQKPRINRVLKEWNAAGFRCPSMYHNLEMIAELDIQYDCSTFDTDPFEPQADGVGTIFPFWVPGIPPKKGYLELPYTLPQDFTLFCLMGNKGIDIWKQKLDWIVERGGMALLIVHPDYVNFDTDNPSPGEYPARYYEEFLSYVKTRFAGKYWNVLPREITRFWVEKYGKAGRSTETGIKGAEESEEKNIRGRITEKKKVWIDLDNSPHVPFFNPIIQELRKNGHEVILTTRDCSQTCGLADLFHMKYRRIGRHYGKQKFLKVAGTILRALQLMRAVWKEKPSLAISHGSRAQMISAWFLKVPSIVLMDYEHVKGFLKPTWIMMPEVIPSDLVKFDRERIIQYPGIKEDIYVPTFKPNPAIKTELGVEADELLVTIRPPATEAHYHNPESEALFSAVVKLVGSVQSTRMVILPRNEVQKEQIQREWSDWCNNRKIIIPENVVDGLNLLWHSDLAISGGGTMNREAAALGVPVYSIFRGQIGAVDRYLAKNGRLTLLENAADVHNKLTVARRSPSSETGSLNCRTLDFIINEIMAILEKSQADGRRP